MIPTLALLLVQAVAVPPPTPPVFGPTDSWVVAVFAQGATPQTAKPLAILKTLKPADLTCDQAPVPRLMTSALVNINPTIGLQWDDPDRPGRYCVTPPQSVTATDTIYPIVVRDAVPTLPECPGDPCPVYEIFLRAENGAGTAWSAAATPAFTLRAPPVVTPPAPRPECVPPLGNRAVSVFPTGISGTSGRPGARAIQGFQLASPNSPIVEVAVRIDGVVVEPVARGDDLTNMPGWWIALPASGTHTLTIQATNAVGCSREVAAAPLVVP